MNELSAKKSLGQHFLRDASAVRRIIELLDIEPGDHVLEIGPGPGALTDMLRSSPCTRLTLLEKDDRFASLHASQAMGQAWRSFTATPWSTLGKNSPLPAKSWGIYPIILPRR